jgi:ParB family chromosome partitioning protein
MSIYFQKEKVIGSYAEIEVSKISPNPNQPRKEFSDEAILKLASSIREHGIIQPLIVRKSRDGYELIAGERRLRAAKELGLTSVPCVVSQISDERSAEASIIENLIREDLSIFEEASAIESLIDIYGLTQEEVARKLSCSQPYIANKLRLLRLSKRERELIGEASLTERHARALLRIQDEELRMNTLLKIIENGLNVTRSEELVEGVLSRVYDSDDKDTEPDKNASKTALKSPSRKELGSFYSTIEKAIDSYREGGIDIKSRRIEGDGYTEITILIGASAKT